MSVIDDSSPVVSRRAFLATAVASAASLTGCVSVPTYPPPTLPRPEPLPDPAAEGGRYGTMIDQGYTIPAVPLDKIDPRLLRQEVSDPTGEAPGTIVVDTAGHFLYHVRGGGRAMRYGVGLGRAGFEWSGRAVIERKQEWPKWFPPAEMIERQPELEEYGAEFDEESGEWRGGMQPGIMNPLGARALYIYEDGKDTLYRVHGSPEWWTIGKSVSSGCVRMINQDVIHLYDNVTLGTPILVTSGIGSV